MGIVEIAKATASYTTAVSVVALAAALFAYVAIRTREGSIRAQMIGDAPLSSAQIVTVLKTFSDDKARLEALKAILSNDSKTAQDVLARMKKYDPVLARVETRANYVAGTLVLGVVLLAFGILGIMARQEDKPHTEPGPVPSGSSSTRESGEDVVVSRSPPGMARVARATIRMGHFPSGQRPPECLTLRADEDCTEQTHPERAGQVLVPAFDIDIEEVRK